MKAFILSFALGLMPVCAHGADEVIRIYHRFQHQPPAYVLAAVERELALLMRPVGLELDWRPFASAAGTEVSVELVIVDFEGTCDVGDLRSGGTYSGTLGSTNITDGAIMPYVNIRCDGVRRLVWPDLVLLPPSARAAAYGRAVARVMAHELYHVFSKSTVHDSSGLAKARFTVRDLLSKRLEFNRKQRALLRAYGVYLTGRVPQPSGN
ncbi:MAG TPA: hypothetical protein VGF59_37585 [Bryobacteraceae bacterium]